MKSKFISFVVWVWAWTTLEPLSQAQMDLSGSYRITAEPMWVAQTRPRESTDATNQTANVVYLLFDNQVNVGLQKAYTRGIKRITSEVAVENESQLEFSFEPSHQTLETHKIVIHRNGVPSNRLKPETLRMIQQEKDAYRQIYNGEKAVVAILEDVRVGDEIEYSFTVTGFNPIFGGKFVDAEFMQYATPMMRRHLRVLWPKGRSALNMKFHGRQREPRVRDLGQEIEYSWMFDDIPALLMEERTPAWFNPYSWVQLSEFGSWGEVRDWAIELYENAAKTGPEIENLVERIKAENAVAEKRVLAALKFAQDDVRYLGIEIGPNSHKPNPAETALLRRFGDCKDKTVLLCAILKGLGIEAAPALVNTYLGAHIEERLPSPLVFNHVIARVRMNGETYWLDPTWTHQGGSLSQVSIDAYARALPLAREEGELATIARRRLSLPDKTVLENLVITNYNNPATLRVTTVLEGTEANSMRRSAAESSLEELQKRYLNYYTKVYSAIRVKEPLQIQDDKAGNRMTILERYEVEKPWSFRGNESTRALDLHAYGVLEAAYKPQTYERKMPLGVRYPTRVKHMISIDLPERGNFPAEEKTVADAYQKFRYEVKHVKKNLSLTFDYESLQDAAPAEATAEFLRNLDSVHELCTYSINYPKTNRGGLAERMNWPILMVGCMAGGILAYGARRYYVWNPPIRSSAGEAGPELQGLGGWLILVGFGVAISPFTVGAFLIQNLSSFSADTWHGFTNPQGVNYHALFGPLLIFELLGNLTLLTMAILGIVQFYKKRAGFPLLFVALQIFNAVFVALDALGGQAIPLVAQQGGVNAGMIRGVMGAFVWSAYMFSSKRVKATFVN